VIYAGSDVVQTAQDAGPVDFMTGYWRSYYMLTPPSVDLKLLKQTAAAVDRGLGKLISKRKVDINKPSLAWPFYYTTSGGIGLFVSTPAPSQNWTGPEFDDSAWPRQRLPMLTWKDLHLDRKAQTEALCCFRARFLVEEPEQAKDLVIEVACRGGAVIYVNGREIGRIGLPRGELAPETPADVYPEGAYILPPLGVGKNPKKSRPVGDFWGEFPVTPPWKLKQKKRMLGQAAAILKVPLEDLTAFGHYSSPSIVTRKEWKEIQKLRDRKIKAAVPVDVLRKGENVLAIEIHRSTVNPVVLGVEGLGTHYWFKDQKDFRWQHAFLIEATMRCRQAGAVKLPERAGGVRVWTGDIHRRLYARDFGPPGREISPIRVVGARGGAFSGQAVVDAGRELSDLCASMSPLGGPKGESIPASAVEVRYAKKEPVSDFLTLHANGQGGRPLAYDYGRLAHIRYVSGIHKIARFGTGWQGTKRLKAALSTFFFFDHLNTAAPESVPAGSCQPVWITVRVPRNAAPGLYAGTLTLAASARSFKVPVRLQVIDWDVPKPQDFRTVMALEPSPYSVAAHYKADLWSEKHFSLIENSFRLLGKVGGDMLIIPVLAKTEFANGSDSMIRWKHKNDRYSCDFSIMKRYLDLALKHIKPLCICFVVSHHWPPGTKGKKYYVVEKNGSGKTSLLEVPLPGTPEALDFWKPLIAGIRTCLKERGMEKAWHWGYMADIANKGAGTTPEAESIFKMFEELAPGVGWARGSHWGAKGRFTFPTTVRGGGRLVRRDRKGGELAAVSHKGWRWYTLDRKGKKKPRFRLVFTRVESPIMWVYGVSNPFKFRIAPEHALMAGAQGIGRWGADCWIDRSKVNWRDFSLQHGSVAMTVTWLLWPGPNGTEGSTRFECLREGLQEAEVRIFLEKKLEENGFVNSGIGKAVKAMLDERIRENLYYQIESHDNCPPVRTEEYFLPNWQQRTWDLYAAAAKAAGGKAPTENEKRDFFCIKEQNSRAE
jgi:hypothetical protein